MAFSIALKADLSNGLINNCLASGTEMFARLTSGVSTCSMIP